MEKSTDQFSNNQLIDEFKMVVTDTEALLNATADSGGEKLAEVRAKAESSLNMVKARMANTQAMMIARAKKAAIATNDYVHENPWKAIGGGAGVSLVIGMVVGLLIGRR